MHSNYEIKDSMNPANFVELTPLSFIKRSRDIYPNHLAVIYHERQYTWQALYERCCRLASALIKQGIKTGDTVSVLAANTPEMFEMHYGIPMSGAVINTINYRLDVDTISYILEHADTKVLVTDTQFSPLVKEALSRVPQEIIVIDINDPHAVLNEGEGELLGVMDYEALLASGDENFQGVEIESEWQALALNYTSGTGGRPKGVIYHHRGSYLMSMGTIAAWPVPQHTVYLYTVPMFHCNGWGHAWTLGAVTGTAICCRYVDPEQIFTLLDQYKVSHFGAAPVVLNMLVNASTDVQVSFKHKIEVMTAGAPPPSKVLAKSQQLGFNITHVYGLTETYGHVIYCAWREQWNGESIEKIAELKSRQGVRFPMTGAVKVVDPDSGRPVPHDGKSMGEILIRSNTMMKGYYKNPEATAKAFKDGWFHTEDLAVVYEDGYLQVRDRLKDIIISGGENISSIEVETVLYKFPGVDSVAVVAKPDEKWGETPCAFIELKPDGKADVADVIAFCREHMAGFKVPKTVVFETLPKTATGKIQKFQLRNKANKMSET